METLVLASSIIGFLLPPAFFGRVLSRLARKSLGSLSNGAYPRSMGFSECYDRRNCEIISFYGIDVREEA
jgi:hypothetical protein